MASRSRKQALIMFLKTFRPALAGIVALLLAAGGSGALAAEETTVDAKPLTPYTAKYRTTTRGVSLTLNRKLERNADDSYTLTNGGKIMVVGFHEMSVFSTQGNAIVPKSYVYQGTGMINRRREVHFTSGAETTIRSLYKDQWYDLPYQPGTLDRFSQQEQLRLLMLNDPDPREDISIRVADGKRVKEYLIRYVGEEMLETPLGMLNTLHFKRIHDDPDRSSATWIAPELDYLMVKTVHVEDGSTTKVLISEVELEGRQNGD